MGSALSVPDGRDARRPARDAATLDARPALAGDVDVTWWWSGPATRAWAGVLPAEADPSLSVVVLEAEVAGFGASGRNGGWCSALFPGCRPPAGDADRPRAPAMAQHAGMRATRRRGRPGRRRRGHRRAGRQGRDASCWPAARSSSRGPAPRSRRRAPGAGDADDLRAARRRGGTRIVRADDVAGRPTPPTARRSTRRDSCAAWPRAVERRGGDDPRAHPGHVDRPA